MTAETTSLAQPARGMQGDELSAQDGRDWGRQWIDMMWCGQARDIEINNGFSVTIRTAAIR